MSVRSGDRIPVLESNARAQMAGSKFVSRFADLPVGSPRDAKHAPVATPCRYSDEWGPATRAAVATGVLALFTWGLARQTNISPPGPPTTSARSGGRWS